MSREFRKRLEEISMNNIVDLSVLRKRIDEIDRQLLPLFIERMKLGKGVADYKRANNMPILDRAREIEVLNNKISLLEGEDKALENEVYEFFASVMAISRGLQAKELDTSKGYDFDEILSHSTKKENPRVLYAGVSGAFAEEALIKYFGEESERINKKNFEEVCVALKNNEADYAVLPIENSATGSITDNVDLISKYNFYITGEVNLKVEQCLLAPKGAKESDITHIYSHEQGLKQCSEYLKRFKNAELEACSNTAYSAKMVAQSNDITKAAIASRRNAKLYGLDILAENINYSSSNTTRFVIISNEAEVSEKADKISVSFTLPHESGTLYNALAQFTRGGLNLLKIESRPVRNKNFEYRFFIDYSGNLRDEIVLGVTKNLAKQTTEFKVLGNYEAGA